MKKIRFIKSVISIVLMTSLFLVVLSRGNEAKAVSQTALETYYVCDDSTGWKYSTQKNIWQVKQRRIMLCLRVLEQYIMVMLQMVHQCGEVIYLCLILHRG